MGRASAAVRATDNVPGVSDDDLDDLGTVDRDDAHPEQLPPAPPRRRGSDSVLFAAMLGIAEVLGRKPKEETPVVVDAPTEPVDVHRDGVSVAIDEHSSAYTPPQPRKAPLTSRPRRRRRSI
jgi:hypothetical protein